MKKQHLIVGTWIIMGSTMVAQYPEIPISEIPRSVSQTPRIDISIQPAASVPDVSAQNDDSYVSYIQQFYQASVDNLMEEEERQKEMNIQSLSSEIIISGKSRVYDVDDFYQTRSRVVRALRSRIGNGTLHLKRHSYKKVRIRRGRRLRKGKTYKQLVAKSKKQYKIQKRKTTKSNKRQISRFIRKKYIFHQYK